VERETLRCEDAQGKESVGLSKVITANERRCNSGAALYYMSVVCCR
jgi:hypothetical protein